MKPAFLLFLFWIAIPANAQDAVIRAGTVVFTTGPDEIRKAVRENLHFGSTFIKLVVDDQRYIYSVEEIRTAVREAELAGTYVAAHCWTEQGARNAIEAGVRSIEHGPDMPDDVLKMAKGAGV